MTVPLPDLGVPLSDWERVSVPAGDVLFEAGDPGDAFYVVQSGTVEAYLADDHGRRVVLERLGPGATFGELALLDGGTRTAGVAAASDATLHVLRRAVFIDALARSPALAARLLTLTGGRLRRNLRHIDHLIAWAELVADGRYDEAQAAIAAAAEAAEDDDTARFVASFTAMLATVRARERELVRALAALRVEIDQARRAESVAEITESEFFKGLQAEARRLRENGSS
ncbi:MAG: cyclic nucleotide-binding domain-containing protein [Ardenticatenales bacterium]|jgi:CRP-like cAMP-binding protein|nr:cyclic nucleotide-binding domain-containing protein [Ardenticatenales bacterium]